MNRPSDVSKIVDKCSGLSGDERVLLKKLFEKLESNQEQVLNNIQSKVDEQTANIRRSPTEWKIYTMLGDNNKAELEHLNNNNFYEVIPHIDSVRPKMKLASLNAYPKDDNDTLKAGNIYGGIAFLNCRYSDIGKYTENNEYSAVVHINGKELSVSYRLNRWRGFLDEEKIIEQTAFQYGVNVPIIYSPMSRHAVEVQVLGLDIKDITDNPEGEIDFQFEINGLNGILQTGKTLLWNIETVNKDNIPRIRKCSDSKITALFDDVMCIYELDAKNNEYYHIRCDNQDLRRFGNTVYVNIDQENDINDIFYVKYIVHDCNISAVEVYDNRYTSNHCSKERVRTKGDIYNVLKCFDKIKFGDILFSGEQDFIRNYGKDDAYHYPKDEVLRSSSALYIKIHDNNDIFFEDYVSYVLSYLNYYYPEFRWVGVK